MPSVPPSQLEYARLCYRSAVHFVRDANAQLAGRRFAGVIVSCQHAWEMAGKAALAIESPYFSFPAHRTTGPHWMRDHRVLTNVSALCNRLRITRKSLRRALQNLEHWLPPGPHLANPPANSEYFFDAGATWKLPGEFFRASHARTAVMALRQVMQMLKIVYKTEFRRLPIK
jgi:hypothetical protein